MALYMTMESAMPIARALRLSLAATDNAAFNRQAETVTTALKNGQSLVDALTRSGLFSVDFLSIVAVGEEGGRLPEVMRQQAGYWNEESAQRLKIATRLAGMLVWLIYAAFMVWAIFSVAGVYFGALGI
jgi:type II secretory pathway component PulF